MIHGLPPDPIPCWTATLYAAYRRTVGPRIGISDRAAELARHLIEEAERVRTDAKLDTAGVRP